MGLVEDLDALLGLLEEIQAEHMVVGGLAVEALGVPRSTLDIDVQVRLAEPPSRTSSYFHGWFIDERSTDAVFGQDVLILEGHVSGVPVELFLTSHWFTQKALDRRQHVESDLLGRQIPIPTAEDFILLKTMYRLSETRGEAKSTQDRLDIEGVLEAHHGEIDTAYLRENAEDLGVWDPLEPLLSDGG